MCKEKERKNSGTMRVVQQHMGPLGQGCTNVSNSEHPRRVLMVSSVLPILTPCVESSLPHSLNHSFHFTVSGVNGANDTSANVPSLAQRTETVLSEKG